MKKILLVDDDKDTLKATGHLLTSHGFNVQTHSTGLNIAEVVTNYKPNLILLGIDLPGKPGIEICRELKKNLTIPIILFSADSGKERVVAESDADDFIQKPFEINQLINIISLHLNLILTVF